MKYVIEDEFDISVAGYWDMFFSDAYNEALWPVLDVDHKTTRFDKKGEGDDLVIDREAELTPHRQPPKALQKLINTTIRYVETNHYVAAKSEMSTDITPNFMADRITNKGTYRVVPQGEGRCKRIWEGVCEAKIPLLGGKVESFLVDEVKESYRTATSFTRKWIADHPVS
jgi:hypothetical protein